MADYPYAKTVGKLERLMGRIHKDGKPARATNKWLQSMGFTSSNDSSLLNVLAFIGIVDESRVPTEAWQKYRDPSKHKQVLAERIHAGYSELFDQFPDAHQRDKGDLVSFFRAKSTLGEKATELMARTFEVLCSMADFDSVGDNGITLDSYERTVATANGKTIASEPDRSELAVPALHLDVQVHISADASESQIDKIFESMARHLYGGKGVEQPQ